MHSMCPHFMTRGIFLAVIVLVAAMPLEGQQRSSSMRRIIVFPKTGEALAGRLLRTDEESVTMLSARSEERIPFSEINRVLLGGESHSGNRGAVMGAILGGYVSTLAFSGTLDGREENGHFLPGNASWLTFVIVTLPGILCGGGIGYLIDSGSDDEEQLLEFTGSEESRRESQEVLLNAWKENHESGTVHISVHAGQVSRTVTDQHGYPTSAGLYGSGAGPFNLLRRLEATYSVIPEVEAGVAVAWFGEPKKISFKYESSGTTSKSSTIDQSFNASGTYAVGVFKPLALLPESKLRSQIDCSVGLGFGFAAADYSLNSFVISNDYMTSAWSEQRTAIPVTKRFMSEIVFVDLGLILQDHLSVGFSFDHVFGPTVPISPIPEAGFPQKSVRFGNSSYGFNIGLHF